MPQPNQHESLPQTFKESEPVSLWSERIITSLPYADFERIAKTTALSSRHRLTGFLTDMGGKLCFTITRYPRQKYGVASVKTIIENTALLAQELHGEVLADSQKDGFRVVLGLMEGYDPHSPFHTIEEARAELGSDAKISRATVFAVRLTKDDAEIYTEPVAVIQAPLHALPQVYNLADSFKQERFTVENFDNHTAYTVETRYCSEPDAAP